jgi:hypothetical protein
LHHDNAPSHSPFHQGIFDQKQHDCHPPPTPLFSVSPIEDKTDLTEHDFQDEFKKWQSSGNGAYAGMGTTSRVMVTSRPKVSFWPDGRTSPGNYGWLLV